MTTFPEGCTVQVIVRTEETGKYDRVFQLFEDSGTGLEQKVIKWIEEYINQILIEKSEELLPF